MVAEKRAVVSALKEIAGLTVLRSSERAITGGALVLPVVSVDYGPYDLSPGTEDGKLLYSDAAFVLTLWVKSLADEEAQEDEFEEWLDKIIQKFIEKFPGFKINASPGAGTMPIGGGQGYGTVFGFERDKFFKITIP